MENKTIFVDFDDTLCLHKYKIVVYNQCIFNNAKFASEKMYQKSSANILLIKYLEEQQKQGAKLILLTSSCSKMLEIKKYWLKQCCENLIFDDYISVSIDITKTEIMLAYSKFYKISQSNIEFIDDSCKERWEAEYHGIITYNPQIIANAFFLSNFNK